MKVQTHASRAKPKTGSKRPLFAHATNFSTSEIVNIDSIWFLPNLGLNLEAKSNRNEWRFSATDWHGWGALIESLAQGDTPSADDDA